MRRNPNSKGHSRRISLNSDHEMSAHPRPSPAPVNFLHQTPRRKESMPHPHPNPPLTPNIMHTSTIPIPNLPHSAPASPPTPAPSPTPHQRAPTWPRSAGLEGEELMLQTGPLLFSRLSIAAKEAWLASIVDLCDNHSLSFLHQLVSPRLKKDPFRALPNELCFRVGASIKALRKRG